jgi:RNA polymerase sigma factor (sigma-70 family)
MITPAARHREGDRRGEEFREQSSESRDQEALFPLPSSLFPLPSSLFPLNSELFSLTSLPPAILTAMSSSAFSGNPQFQTTHWSLVAAAASKSPEAQAALEDLCRTYWYPVYAFIRRRGHQPSDAGDLTQEFFARLIEKEHLDSADQSRGRFRTFLLTAVTRFLANEQERAAAQKRGGGKRLLSLSIEDGESRYLREPADQWTPERLFARRWALTVLDRTLARLRNEHEEAGKAATFEVLKAYLTGESGAPTLRQAADRLAMTEGAAKVAVHRLRQKYRELLRGEIAQTVTDDGEIEDELKLLLGALRGDRSA